MRNKRIRRFKRMRRKKTRNFLLLAVVMPTVLVLLGYLVASVIILPSMSG